MMTIQPKLINGNNLIVFVMIFLIIYAHRHQIRSTFQKMLILYSQAMNLNQIVQASNKKIHHKKYQQRNSQIRIHKQLAS